MGPRSQPQPVSPASSAKAQGQVSPAHHGGQGGQYTWPNGRPGSGLSWRHYATLHVVAVPCHVGPLCPTLPSGTALGPLAVPCQYIGTVAQRPVTARLAPLHCRATAVALGRTPPPCIHARRQCRALHMDTPPPYRPAAPSTMRTHNIAVPTQPLALDHMDGQPSASTAPTRHCLWPPEPVNPYQRGLRKDGSDKIN